MTKIVGYEKLVALYIGFFGRPADPDGFEYWVDALENGVSIDAIAQSFFAATENDAMRVDQNSTTAQLEAYVEAIYQNLFNREADTEGLNYWVGQIQNGNFSVSDMITTIAFHAVGSDVVALSNKIDVAMSYTTSAKIAGDFDADKASDVLNGVDHTDASVKTATDSIKNDFFPDTNTGGGGTTIIEVPVEVEKAHVITYAYDATVDITATNQFKGTELIVGDGIYTDGKVQANNLTAGFELSMGANYRQGEQLLGTKVSDGVIRITADAGPQTLETGDGIANANRSAVSFDYTLATGVNDIGEAGYKFQLLIDTNPLVGETDFLVVDFKNDTVLGSDYWAGYLDGNPVIGDEVPNTNVLQESTNFGFGFISNRIDGIGETSGDIPAGEYEVYAQVLNADGDVVTKVGIIFDLVNPVDLI